MDARRHPRVTDTDFDESRTDIAKKIRRFRHEAGLTQEMLARRLDMTQATVWQWESGAAVPRAASLVALAAALGVSVDILLDAAAARPGATTAAEPPSDTSRARQLRPISQSLLLRPDRPKWTWTRPMPPAAGRSQVT